MENTNNTASFFASALSGTIGFLQTDQILQYIAFAVAIASGVFSIGYTIFKMIILYQNAKEDGKITLEELEEIRKAGEAGLTSSQLEANLKSIIGGK